MPGTISSLRFTAGGPHSQDVPATRVPFTQTLREGLRRRLQTRLLRPRRDAFAATPRAPAQTSGRSPHSERGRMSLLSASQGSGSAIDASARRQGTSDGRSAHPEIRPPCSCVHHRRRAVVSARWSVKAPWERDQHVGKWMSSSPSPSMEGQFSGAIL